MSTDAQKRACRRYYAKTKAVKRVIALRFDKKGDEDILQMLDSVPSKTAYIRNLVREDLDNER